MQGWCCQTPGSSAGVRPVHFAYHGIEGEGAPRKGERATVLHYCSSLLIHPRVRNQAQSVFMAQSLTALKSVPKGVHCTLTPCRAEPGHAQRRSAAHHRYASAAHDNNGDREHAESRTHLQVGALTLCAAQSRQRPAQPHEPASSNKVHGQFATP